MSDSNHINCPNCGTDLDINDVVYRQLQQQAEKEYRAKSNEDQKKLKEQQQQLDKRAEQLEEQVSQRLNEATAALKVRLKNEAQSEQADFINQLKQQLQDQAIQLVELNTSRAAVEKLKREKQTLRSEIELELEKKVTAKVQQQTEQIKQQTEAKLNLQVTEKEHIINQLREQLSQAQMKAEQGSSQLFGETQEIAIESWLRHTFPLDEIEEIKKGERGADTLQIVNANTGSPSGTIYYESKRTKTFQPNWIYKFKEDIQSKNADIGVLVSQSLPEGMDGLGQIDGVWVCSFEQFRHLSQVLRQSLIQLYQTRVINENRGDKMGLLYEFLTGNEFRMQIESIVEGFMELKSELEREKRAMQGSWKRREKQLERVLLNTNHMYNSVKGIAGSAVKDIPALEMQHSLTKD